MSNESRIVHLERQLQAERHARLRAEQQASGLKSASRKSRALVLTARAETARLKAAQAARAEIKQADGKDERPRRTLTSRSSRVCLPGPLGEAGYGQAEAHGTNHTGAAAEPGDRHPGGNPAEQPRSDESDAHHRRRSVARALGHCADRAGQRENPLNLRRRAALAARRSEPNRDAADAGSQGGGKGDADIRRCATRSGWPCRAAESERQKLVAVARGRVPGCDALLVGALDRLVRQYHGEIDRHRLAA
jgi:hypothetical protein